MADRQTELRAEAAFLAGIMSGSVRPDFETIKAGVVDGNFGDFAMDLEHKTSGKRVTVYLVMEADE